MMPNYPFIVRCKCCGYALRFNSCLDFTTVKDMDYTGNVELLTLHETNWEYLSISEFSKREMGDGPVLRQDQA